MEPQYCIITDLKWRGNSGYSCILCGF